ncbi:SRPBCC family protein [Saccharothrix saharensis]|uniref:SRPBCC family protein n=1 Tax=Saccharothrix saharensis TaxID=571190 RepID=UPI00368D5E22
MDIDLNAPVISRHSIEVKASMAEVWALHTDVSAWPDWQPDITSASLPGPFAAGAAFSWETFGLTITSTVTEAEPLRRTCWGGPARAGARHRGRARVDVLPERRPRGGEDGGVVERAARAGGRAGKAGGAGRAPDRVARPHLKAASE